jgi:type I restriction enzyme S subunit
MNQYEKYIETGIEWLNNIPSHWNKIRLRYLCDITTGKRDTVNREDDGQYPFFVRSKTIERISTFSYDGEAILTAGDGDICKIWHHVNEKFDFHQRVYMLYNFKKVTGRFLFYYISENFYHDVFKLSAKNTVDSLRLPMFLNFPVLVPPLEEQNKIAGYLDYQTNIIDQLIQQKEKLIELLKDKKQAIINEAVTKGLDSNAKMKDSGINWLGEVPKEWKVIKLKFLVDHLESGVSVNSENTSIEIDSKDRAVLKTSCVFNYSFNPHENKKVVDEEYNRVQCSVKKNTIIISRMNTPDLVGASGYVERDYPNLFLPDRLWQTVFNDKMEIDVEYISNVLRSEIYKSIYSIIATGTSPSMKNIAQNSFLDLPIPLPKIKEQVNIKSYLKKADINITTAIRALETSIEKLKEYRQSIISEAVTGKIDVRDWQPINQK